MARVRRLVYGRGMRAFASLAVAAVALSASGCATLFADKQVAIPISSARPGAAITIDGFPAGATPAVIRIEAHHPHVIVVRGAGGAGGCRLDPSVGAGWIILDFIAGVWPLVVDLVTQDWNTVDEAGCFVPV